MSPNDFRRIALGMEGAVESAHMGHQDFRLNGRIFATLHHDQKWGMVELTPGQQETFVRETPGTFAPENGAWGRQGCRKVRLESVDEDTLGEAMTLAWQNAAGKGQASAPKEKTKREQRKGATARSYIRLSFFIFPYLFDRPEGERCPS
jgi:hypothetical protein